MSAAVANFECVRGIVFTSTLQHHTAPSLNDRSLCATSRCIQTLLRDHTGRTSRRALLIHAYLPRIGTRTFILMLSPSFPILTFLTIVAILRSIETEAGPDSLRTKPQRGPAVAACDICQRKWTLCPHIQTSGCLRRLHKCLDRKPWSVMQCSRKSGAFTDYLPTSRNTKYTLVVSLSSNCVFVRVFVLTANR
jgi:hypothetical protein